MQNTENTSVLDIENSVNKIYWKMSQKLKHCISANQQVQIYQIFSQCLIVNSDSNYLRKFLITACLVTYGKIFCEINYQKPAMKS